MNSSAMLVELCRGGAGRGCARRSARASRRRPAQRAPSLDLGGGLADDHVPPTCSSASWISSKTSSIVRSAWTPTRLPSRGSGRRAAPSRRGRTRAAARSPPACRRRGPPRARRCRRSHAIRRRAGARRPMSSSRPISSASRRARRPAPSCAGSRRAMNPSAASASRAARGSARSSASSGTSSPLSSSGSAFRPSSVPVGDRRAQDVAGRDVRDAVLGGDQLRLGSLARSLGAKQEDVHAARYLRKPS